ncbi:MAG: AraC family transcriptional regulator [Wolinella sp.]
MPKRVSAAAIDFILSQLPVFQPHTDAFKESRDACELVDIDVYKRFFLGVVDTTGNQNLGLLIGKRVHTNALGILGYILENSPTLGVAIENLLRYHTLLSQSLTISLTIGNRYVKITLSITPPENPPVDRYSNEINLATLATILNNLVAEHIHPNVVKFTHAKPDSIDSYYAIFGKNIEFDASQNAIYYPKEILLYPIRCPNATMLEFFKVQAQRILEDNEEGYSVRVTRVLSEMLNYRVPDVNEVAARLYTTTRTL